ncbi:hypothetical protein GH714_027528 [Hevea brasiliensis]|uniref:Gnk2-homologous domain-containing protein n=1 Tax=Hevea brasiliensis TaxID=3981 RepID=A0A6A6K896_HEVBR|nr:hypothetical protein GH714_027528 [Hevea brasiliensis]
MLVFRTAITSFAAVSCGQGQDKVYGLGKCRGDVSSKECYTCYDNKISLEKLILSIVFTNDEEVRDFEDFDQELGAILRRNRGLGKGEKKLFPSVTLYALVQCTRELPQTDC